MSEAKTRKDRNSALTPLKAAYKVAQILSRVPEGARKNVLQGAAAELSVQL